MQRQIFQRQLQHKEAQGPYILHGIEGYMMDFIVDFIKKTYVDASTIDLNLTETSIASITPGQMLEMAETLPVFSDKRVLILHDCDFTKEGMGKYKAHYEALLDYVDTFPEELLLLLLSPYKSIFQGKFVKKMKGMDRLVPIEKMNEGELVHFIKNEAKKNKKRIDERAVHMIVKRSEYVSDDSKNLYGITNLLDALLGGNQEEVGTALVERFLPEPITDRIFGLTDAMAQNKMGECLRLYTLLRQEGQSVHQMFPMIVRQVRDMIRVKGYVLRPTGQSGAQELGMQGFVFTKLQKAVAKYSFHDLYAMYRLLYDIAFQMRDVHADDDALMTWMLAELCKE